MDSLIEEGDGCIHTSGLATSITAVVPSSLKVVSGECLETIVQLFELRNNPHFVLWENDESVLASNYEAVA